MPDKISKQLLSAIKALPTERPLIKEDLLTDSFLIESAGKIKMYYAPHNEYINKEAKIVIIGITPGWRQMSIAFSAFIKGLEAGDHLNACFYHAKISARFAGSMRTNLIHMLDQCDLPKALNIPHSAYLFDESKYLLHTTSIIKYPVFVHEKNYTGHNPPIEHSNVLQHYAYSKFPKELAQINTPALVIPLGKTVEGVLKKLIREGQLSDHKFLFGFPHPSGANGHRVKQFNIQKENLREAIEQWSLQNKI